jgi:glycosyltransferase involved in cell wall biosynthesis
MGLTQRLDVLIHATNSEHWPGNALLLLVGDGAARGDLQVQAAGIQTGRVQFLPYQPRNELATSLSAADLHVVSMHERISGCLCPSKLYGILAAGRPVLAIAAAETDLCRTVTKHELGWCCIPGDAETIARSVATAASDRDRLVSAGLNARSLACDQFDRLVVFERFREMLTHTLNEKAASLSTHKCDNVSPPQAFQVTNVSPN